jgi:hypothetical protein
VVSDSILHALQMGRSSHNTSHSIEAVSISRDKQSDYPPFQGDVFDGLYFKQGKVFANECLRKFGQNVNLDKLSSRKPFFLVCSFGRACFRLDVHTVALALQACFGGFATLYNVKALRDRSFRF